MPQYHYGLGAFAFIPSGSNPTPVQFAVLQDVTLDFSVDIKELRGQYQVAVDAARGPLKITGKAKNAVIAGAILMAALPGVTKTTGSKKGVVGELITVPTTPFQVIVANGATFYENLGVVNLTTGLMMERGATATAVNVYAVNDVTGQYTFHSGAAGNQAAINYAYTASADGFTYTLNNLIQAQSVGFVGTFYNIYGGKQLGWRFPACHVPKFALALKAEAYTEQDLDWFVTQDPASAKVMDFWTKEH